MTDADVRAALCALAEGTSLAATADADYTAIDDATAALDDIRETAGFVDSGGLPRLRRAVERAERAGDDAPARRGRDALAAIERCRRAAAAHF